MSAYIILDVEVADGDLYGKYKKHCSPTLEKFGGKFLVRGGSAHNLEGDWQPHRIVIIEFDSLERAKAWWSSEEYRVLKQLRQRVLRWACLRMTPWFLLKALPPVMRWQSLKALCRCPTHRRAKQSQPRCLMAYGGAVMSGLRFCRIGSTSWCGPTESEGISRPTSIRWAGPDRASLSSTLPSMT